MSKPIVYIASPYTKGDPAINTRFQMEMFNNLLNSRIMLPYAPLVSHFQHTIFPQPYKVWIDYDLEMLTRFDICLRLPAVCTDYNELFYYQYSSSGADGEVKAFENMGKPVFAYEPPIHHNSLQESDSIETRKHLVSCAQREIEILVRRLCNYVREHYNV
jgi:hypothetical protein